MKKKNILSIYLELCIILLLYIILPLLRTPNNLNTTISPDSLQVLVESTIGSIILIFLSARRIHLPHLYAFSMRSVKASIIVLASMLIVRALFVTFFPPFSLPVFHASFIAVFSVFSAAFFEELLFRVYTFSLLEILVPHMHIAKAISILIFAGAHYYQGMIGITHSAIQAIILTYAFCKQRNVVTVTMAHAMYNIIVLEEFFLK